MIVWIYNNLHFYVEKIGLLIWFDCCKKSWMPLWYIPASDNCVESFDLPKKISTEMLLQLRKHNIAKNYSKENQELQIKSSRIVNMIKHFISSPKTSFCILWIFQMPLTPFKRERGLKKNRRKNTKPTLVDTSTWTHSKDGPQTIQTPFKVSRKAGAGMVCVVVIIKCLKYSRKTMGKKPLLR